MANPELFMTCPFCRERRANISLSQPKRITPDDFGIIEKSAEIRATGACYLCKNEMVVFLSATARKGNPSPIDGTLQHFDRCTRHGENLLYGGWVLAPVQTFPPLTPYQIPENLPGQVHEALLEAHDNASDRRWRSAVMGYATTLEFACIDLLNGEMSLAPLGGKLKELKGRSQLPPQLIDFIGIVNLDRRAAGHYTDPITEAACDAARVLTVTTLEYLYSLPAEIEQAKLRLEKAQGGHNPAA